MVKRGLKIALLCFLPGLILIILRIYWAGIVFILISIYVLWFFRDPERIPPSDDGYISPADGKVIKIFETEDPYIGKAKGVSIFMSAFDVHVNRSPCDGEIVKKNYKKGKFKVASTDGAQFENERNEIMMKGKKGEKLKFVQIAGSFARRIFFFKETGDYLSKGERVGYISFGSRVDLFLPERCIIMVKEGEKVRAGESIIGKLNEEESKEKQEE